MKFKLIILLFLILYSPEKLFSQEELKGQWLRVEDDIENPDAWKGENYDSLVIEVKEVDSLLIGVMLQVPQNAVDHGYSEGQIKWKNFVKTGTNKYELEGLLMDRGSSGKYDVPVYIKVHLKILDKSTIKLWTAEQSDRFGGKKQKWIRIPAL